MERGTSPGSGWAVVENNVLFWLPLQVAAEACVSGCSTVTSRSIWGFPSPSGFCRKGSTKSSSRRWKETFSPKLARKDGNLQPYLLLPKIKSIISRDWKSTENIMTMVKFQVSTYWSASFLSELKTVFAGVMEGMLKPSEECPISNTQAVPPQVFESTSSILKPSVLDRLLNQDFWDPQAIRAV
nr:PREDICTED: uncharacterized protein LOC108952197 isoform X2 [Musa acuminata subsp. malaccensis]